MCSCVNVDNARTKSPGRPVELRLEDDEHDASIVTVALQAAVREGDWLTDIEAAAAVCACPHLVPGVTDELGTVTALAAGGMLLSRVDQPTPCN